MIEAHGTLVTAMLVVLFLATMGYTVWVIVLDIRETRADAEADRASSDTMECEAYTFQQEVQRAIRRGDDR